MAIRESVSRWSGRHRQLSTFVLGAFIGCIAVVVYLACGGDTFLFVPGWAQVAFYPGFFVGYSTYRLVGESAAVYVGALAVGLSYGVVALGIRELVVRYKRRAKGAA